MLVLGTAYTTAQQSLVLTHRPQGARRHCRWTTRSTYSRKKFTATPEDAKKKFNAIRSFQHFFFIYFEKKMWFHVLMASLPQWRFFCAASLPFNLLIESILLAGKGNCCECWGWIVKFHYDKHRTKKDEWEEICVLLWNHGPTSSALNQINFLFFQFECEQTFFFVAAIFINSMKSCSTASTNERFSSLKLCLRCCDGWRWWIRETTMETLTLAIVAQVRAGRLFL